MSFFVSGKYFLPQSLLFIMVTSAFLFAVSMK